jgi:3'-phosphoadenosine 5'-phosphosulfate sulfotransferase (PAPS reductase)/FAD synthetase
VVNNSVRHILSLSGGKDSAALAIFMRDRVPQMEYVFHDTDKELPETYDYLGRLEALLGKPIFYSRPEYSFDKWLEVYGGMIPSSQRRWCTRMLKLVPFEHFVGDGPVINYVGLRADEEREGYLSSKANITTVYPFREAGLVRADIIRILEESGLGLPSFTKWGRSRSGCYFCFFQQKIEWVRLRERHPELFERAKEYEHANMIDGTAFYWSGDEPLSELEKPERVEAIKADWDRSRQRYALRPTTLVQILAQAEDEDEEEREACLICEL